MSFFLLHYARATVSAASRIWVNQNLALHGALEHIFSRCREVCREAKWRHTLLIIRNCQTLDTVQNDPSRETERYTDHRAHFRALSRPAAPPPLLTAASKECDAAGSEETHKSITAVHIPENVRPGLLGLPDLSVPTDFTDMAQAAVGECRTLLLNPQTFTTPKRAVQTLDLISNILCCVADAAEFARQLHPSERWKVSSTSVVQLVQNFIGHVNLDGALYQRLRELYEPCGPSGSCCGPEPLTKIHGGKTNEDWVDAMTREEREVLRLMLEAMEQQGVHQQSTEKKAHCLRLLEQEQKLSVQLAQGVGHDAGVWVCKEAAASVLGEAEVDRLVSRRALVGKDTLRLGYRASSDREVRLIADSEPAQILLRHCARSEVREKIWKTQRLQSKGNLHQMIALLTVRQQLAQLRNYPSWSHFAKREGIVKTDSGVEILVRRSLEGLRPGVQREFEVLNSMKQEDRAEERRGGSPSDEGLHPWDIPYYTTRMKQRVWSETSAKLRERLSVHAVVGSYARLMETLFGVALNPVVPHPDELWHWSILKFHLLRKEPQSSGSFQSGAPKRLGTLYLDLFDRPGKPRMDAQFSIRGSRLMNYVYRHMHTQQVLNTIGVVSSPRDRETVSGMDPILSKEYRQTPCCVLVCNLKAPLRLAYESKDLERYVHQTTMTATEARNIFHELGHVTHALLSTTGLQHLSGTRGAVDFTEFPSHLFEHFITDDHSLSRVIPLQCGDRRLMETYHKGVNLFGHIEATQLALKTAVDMVTEQG